MATLTTYRRTLAPLLGSYDLGAASATANNTTTALECLTHPFKSDIRSDSTFTDKWLHRPSAAAAADKDRWIKTDTPSSGLFAPDLAWTNAPTSEAFEILGLFSGADLNALLNEALKKIFVLRDLTFTVTSQNVRKHQLNATATWLKSWTWIYQLGRLMTGESWTGTASLPAIDPYQRQQAGKGYDRGGQVWIEGPSWLATDTAYALCACRAYDLCKPTAGAYGDQSGLSLESDEAPVDDTWLAWVAIIVAANRLEHLEQSGKSTQEAMRSRSMAAARVSELTAYYWHEPERTFRPTPTYIGPTLARRGGRRW